MLIVMIMLRLWLVLSLSAAAPVSSTEEKEAREDTPSVEIVIKSDALHSHSSENTNGYPRSIYIGGNVHIEVEGHNAQINLASILGEDASQAIDGGWTSFGECTTTCEGGRQTRTCTDPPPQHGGKPCSGDDSQPCNEGITCTYTAWRRKNEADCWTACGSKDGSCPTFCGDGGFCCRKDFDGCPTGAAESSPKHHTCVIKTGAEVLELNAKNFEEVVSSYGYIVVVFHSLKCGYSEQLLFEYNKASAILAKNPIGSYIKLAKIDDTVHRAPGLQYKIKEHPTMKLFYNGQEIGEYRGARTADAIVDWLNRKKSGTGSEDDDTADRNENNKMCPIN